MDAIAADLTEEQQKDLQALTAYVTEKCMGQGVAQVSPERSESTSESAASS